MSLFFIEQHKKVTEYAILHFPLVYAVTLCLLCVYNRVHFVTAPAPLIEEFRDNRPVISRMTLVSRDALEWELYLMAFMCIYSTTGVLCALFSEGLNNVVPFDSVLTHHSDIRLCHIKHIKQTRPG